MNAEMIVKALKHCAKHNCEGCPYNGPSNFTGDCIDREEVLLIAADLIESLQAQLAEKETTLNGTYISMDAHEREVKKLKAEIGYEQDRIDCRNPICNSNREGMYRRCAELEELLEAAIAGQETLQKALAGSQRRERAAVEDLETAESCITCEHDWDCEYSNSNGCSIANYKWRGPQEGEGNAETDNPD